jgi:hypothetical protein
MSGVAGCASRGAPAGSILAAVHASSEDPIEQELNRTILDWALLLCDVNAAPLTILQAWMPYGAGILKSHMPAEEYTEFVEATRRSETDALAHFVESYAKRLENVSIESAYGEPEEAIPRQYRGTRAPALARFGLRSQAGGVRDTCRTAVITCVCRGRFASPALIPASDACCRTISSGARWRRRMPV